MRATGYEGKGGLGRRTSTKGWTDGMGWRIFCEERAVASNDACCADNGKEKKANEGCVWWVAVRERRSLNDSTTNAWRAMKGAWKKKHEN
jgi:hypothetical protein